MFSVGSYMSIFQINDNGRYALCNCASSRKNRETNAYETDFSGYVKFVKDAYDVVKQYARESNGHEVLARVKITSCAVGDGKYDKEKKTKYYNFTVFQCEDMSGGNRDTNKPSSASKPDRSYINIQNIPENVDEELPF